MARYDINIPDFTQDPFFAKSQEALFPFGASILEGNIPDYFKDIGEFGGEAFEDILGLTQRDVSKSILEDQARKKSRSGRGTNILARTMGDITKKLQIEYLMRYVQVRM